MCLKCLQNLKLYEQQYSVTFFHQILTYSTKYYKQKDTKQDNLTQHILALLQVKLNTFLVAFSIVSL